MSSKGLRSSENGQLLSTAFIFQGVINLKREFPLQIRIRLQIQIRIWLHIQIRLRIRILPELL
jgi:hypothetical protein